MTPVKVGEALAAGARAVLPVAATCAAAGIIVAVVTLTGLGLNLSGIIIDVAGGDLGSSAARKYDTEAWVPTQNTYRELTSTSNCTTFQARLLGIRERRPGEDATRPVATLNGTLATTRWLVAILETHQQADGSVIVPEPLRPYMRGLEILEPTR